MESYALKKKLSYRQCGFTLIEIMVVVVIIGILAAIVVPNIMNRPEQARQVRAKQDILAIENALQLYKLDNGIYPSNEQGLEALIKKPILEPIPTAWKEGGYLKKLPQDPWGHAYHYLNPGKKNPNEIDVFTYGSSNAENPNDPKQTIGNWEE